MPSALQYLERFSEDEACLEHLFAARFGDKAACPKCGRRANWYRIKGVRSYRSSCCLHSLSPMANTLFHNSKIPLKYWFYAIYHFSTCSSGIGGRFLSRHLGISESAAWRVGNQIRRHMTAIDQDRTFGDPACSKAVYINETLLRGIRTTNVPGKGRIRLLGIADRDAAASVPWNYARRAGTITKLISRIQHGSLVYVQDAKLEELLASHKLSRMRNLKIEQILFATRADPLASYWLALKRTIRRNHLHINRKYIQIYLGEFEFRYNRRVFPDKILSDLLSIFPQIT